MQMVFSSKIYIQNVKVLAVAPELLRENQPATTGIHRDE
jgi:hypothetical protein